MPEIQCPFFANAKNTDKGDEVKFTNNEECIDNTCATNSCDKHAKTCRLVKLSLSGTVILLILIVTVFILYCSSSYDKQQTESSSAEQDAIYLPCAENSTVKQDTKILSYCKQEHNTSHKALINLFTLIYTEYVGRRNLTTDPAEKDDNRPILKQKFSEQYYVDKTNQTNGVLELHSIKNIGVKTYKNKTRLQVPRNGSYLFFASILYCFRKQNHTSGDLALQIIKQSRTQSSVLFHNRVHYRNGLLTFVPNNCLFPARLNQDEMLYIHITGNRHLYEMHIGNVVGFRAIKFG